MLTLAAALLGLTALLGVGLLALSQWFRRSGPVWWPSAGHGLLGALGFILLVAAFAVPACPDPKHFGLMAIGMLGLALTAGLTIFVAGMRRRPSSFLVLSLHATFAGAGIALLAAYLAV